METLRHLLRRAHAGLKQGWLYLPRDQEWSLEAHGVIIDVDELSEAEVDENDEPLLAQANGLISTLDAQTIEDIVRYARGLDVDVTDELLLESFLYYYKHDAFLPEPGFKPLSPAESQQKMDREFYDLLGEERSNQPCRRETCQRGSVVGSVLCRVHHFEMVQRRPCPFSD